MSLRRRPETMRMDHRRDARATFSEEAKRIAHRYSGQKVADILKQKKGSIKQAQLPKGSPSWDKFGQMTWEQIEEGARVNKPGFKVVRRLLTDKRFDR